MENELLRESRSVIGQIVSATHVSLYTHLHFTPFYSFPLGLLLLLPPELLQEILLWLDGPSIATMEQVSRDMKRLAGDNTLWKRFCCIENVEILRPNSLVSVFGELVASEMADITDYTIDYKQAFVSEFRRRMRLRKGPKSYGEYPPPQTEELPQVVEEIPPIVCLECAMTDSSGAVFYALLTPRSCYVNHTFTNNCRLAPQLRDFSPKKHDLILPSTLNCRIDGTFMLPSNDDSGVAIEEDIFPRAIVVEL